MQIAKTNLALILALVLCLAASGARGQTSSSLSAPLERPIIELKFRDFFASPVGPRGLEPSAALRAADGQRVRLVGYMVAQEHPPAGSFFLTPLPLQMSEHADGDADDLPPSTVTVVMPQVYSRMPLAHTRGLMQLTGVLSVGRAEAADGRVSWVRLLLDLQTVLPAKTASSSANHLGHKHD
jgi:hypothetical protein